MSEHEQDTSHGHSEHDHSHHQHSEHEHHAVPLSTYLAVFGALCVLTMASFFTYTEIWRNHFNAQAGWSLMMAVSCCKALLVILFFMHLKYEANWKYVLTIPASFMSIFLMLMLVPDVGRRMYRYSAQRWEHTSDYNGAAFYISQMMPVPDDLDKGDHADAHAHDIEHQHADDEHADGEQGEEEHGEQDDSQPSKDGPDAPAEEPAS